VIDENSWGGRNTGRPPVSCVAANGSRQLFLVERRVPAIAEHELALLQAALTEASGRFTARGEHVWYLRSIFLARQDRLLSLFAAEDAEIVRAVNVAALVPFASIEPAVELPGPGQP
jgi:hypothetical protein